MKILQRICCEWVGCRILPCGKVQMLSFSTASEPVNVLVETLQWKVSQCVVAVCLNFFSVQMLEFPRIFGIAMLAAYTVAPRHSTPRCLTYLIWRYTVALRHPQLQEAIAGANKFASHRLLTSVTSFFISPNGAANIFALLSVSAYICQRIFYKTV